MGGERGTQAGGAGSERLPSRILAHIAILGIAHVDVDEESIKNE